jgi:hypothetical protein
MIIVVLLFLLWLLIGPVIIVVDSASNRYFLNLPGIFQARLVPTEELFHVKGWILFVPYRFNPFKKRKQKRKKKDAASDKKKKFKVPKGGVGMVKDAVRTIRVRKLDLDLDTDDFLLNAWLVPVFSLINLPNTRLHVNFEGKSTFLIDMRIRLGALLWVFIRNRYKSFF